MRNTKDNNSEELRSVPQLCEFNPGICLTTEEKHGKTSVRLVKECCFPLQCCFPFVPAFSVNILTFNELFGDNYVYDVLWYLVWREIFLAWRHVKGVGVAFLDQISVLQLTGVLCSAITIHRLIEIYMKFWREDGRTGADFLSEMAQILRGD